MVFLNNVVCLINIIYSMTSRSKLCCELQEWARKNEQNELMEAFKRLNEKEIVGPKLNSHQMHKVRGRINNCFDYNIPIPPWDVIYYDIINNTYSTEQSWTIKGLRHVRGKPNLRRVMWCDTIEEEININVDEMSENDYIKLYPSNEDVNKLRNEYHRLVKIKDETDVKKFLQNKEENEPIKISRKSPKKTTPNE